MLSLAFIAAAWVVLGAPALITAWGYRRCRAPVDAIELVAIGYSGMAVSAIALWLGSHFGGFNWWVIVLASAVSGALLLALPAAARWTPRRPAAGGAPDMLSQQDERGAADAAIDQRRRGLGCAAVATPTHFAMLTVAGALFALCAYVPFLNYGWQRPDGVHRMAMTDWYKHLATTSSLFASDAFPPANPFLQVDAPAPYYYGYHLVAAAVAKLAAAFTAPAAAGNLVYPSLLGLTLLTAFAVPFVVYTFARTVASDRSYGRGDGAGVALVAAFGGTFLAGFDLLPVALDAAVNLARGAANAGGMTALRAVIPSTHLDYWVHHNERQFNAPYLATIWAPQHMAAVLIALVVIHLVLRRRLAGERTTGSRGAGASWFLPAVLLASLPALSAYVALGLAVGVLGAILVESVWRWSPPPGAAGWEMWSGPGLVAVALSLPVLAAIAAAPVVGWTIAVSDAGGWVNGAVFSALFGANGLTRTLDTPAVYVVEFGAVGLLAIAELRRRIARGRLPFHQRHVVWVLATVLLLVVFVRPAIGAPNNLYARPLVLVWFLLTPFAAMRFASLVGGADGTAGAAANDRGALRRVLAANRRWAPWAVILCLAANGYALLGVTLEGAMFWATPAATVEVAEWVNDNTAPGEVVAVAPQEFSRAFGYWLRRPMAIADAHHARLFGADAEAFAEVSRALRTGRDSAHAEVAAAAVDAAAAAVWVLARRGGEPSWVASACFSTVFGNADWLVVRRTAAACS